MWEVTELLFCPSVFNADEQKIEVGFLIMMVDKHQNCNIIHNVCK